MSREPKESHLGKGDNTKAISSNPASTNVLYNLLVWFNKYVVSMHCMLGSELGAGACSKCVYGLRRESVSLRFLKVKKMSPGSDVSKMME